MRHLFLLLLCLTASAQNHKITYVAASNGKPTGDTLLVFTNTRQTLLTRPAIVRGKANHPHEETFLLRSQPGTYYRSARLDPTRSVLTKDSVALANQRFEILPGRKKLLGYDCKVARTVVNSNTIEIWYTDALGLKGAPSILGQELGLVLETVRNGNYSVRAVKVEKVRSFPQLPSTKSVVDGLTYRDRVWKSQFTTLPILHKQVLNFSEDAVSNDSILRFGGGTVAVRKIRFPQIQPGSLVFVDLTEQSTGDAYDRTGSVFALPAEGHSFFDALSKGIETVPVYENGNGKRYQGVVRDGPYEPMLELMRFFTPFGVKAYNYLQLKDKVWQDSVQYRQDISDLIPALSGKEAYIGVVIGNYDKGGHTVSANITIHRDADSEKPGNTGALPLFNTLNVLEMRGQEYGSMFSSKEGLKVRFDLPRDVKNARLRYITTGHGGWENGDEYLRKKNTILLDGHEVFAFIPWKTDCGSYRLSNPASGNFDNGLSSSDYSRSNWCPGTTTNPIWIDLGDLKAGSHTLQVNIPMGAPEGGSFSSWNVSGVLEFE